MKRIIFVLSVALLMVISCQKGQNNDSNVLSFSVTVPVVTKVNGTTFETGDALSVWAVEQPSVLQVGGNYLNNEQIVFNGSSWQGARTLYWSNSPCDFYALYPYQAEVNSVTELPFVLQLDQNSPKSGSTLGGFEASDLMYAVSRGKQRSDGTVDLALKHLMSKCTVNIIKGDNYVGQIPDDIVVRIYNTDVTCTVNIEEGSLQRDSSNPRKTITMKKIDNEHFEAVVIPQHIENTTPLVEVTMGGIAYLLEHSISFKPQYNHTINLVLNTSPDQEMIEIGIDVNTGNWN